VPISNYKCLFHKFLNANKEHYEDYTFPTIITSFYLDVDLESE